LGVRFVQAARNRVLARVALQDGTESLSGAGDLSGSDLAGAVAGQRRIRVGLLCRTFEKGPDSEAVLAFFLGFDQTRYEIFAYSIGFRDRVVSKDPGFDRLFDATIAHRRDLPDDPAGIRTALRADRLDVFLYANATTYGLQPLDLALFHRIAPLQIVLNSHVPMPMGYPSFDAVLTGQSDQPDHDLPQPDYAERLIPLPGPVINYLTTLEPRPNPPLDRAALGLQHDDIVLMNAGSSMKLRHACLATMMRAVRDIPRGVLLLAPYNPGWAARSMAFVFNRQIAETAAETGLDPSRIRILGELSVAEAEAALACADLYLNPFPHGGATMTHLALIHGVPPVTLRRASTRSIDQFLVETHGFAELLANTPDDYIALARNLATDHQRRKSIVARLKIAAKNPGFVRNPAYSKAMQTAIETEIARLSGGPATASTSPVRLQTSGPAP
jgi:predicted O-linked N-acetylglucosamine transferase (SPINDLY family)